MSARPDRPPGEPEDPQAYQLPGEHWRSDLVVWGLPVFGEPVDGLFRELFALGGPTVLDGQSLLPDLEALFSRSLEGTASQAELDNLQRAVRELLARDRTAASRPLPQKRRRRWPKSRENDG